MRRFKAVASIYDAALINRTVPGRSRQLSTALQRESYAATSPSSFNTAARFPASAITTRKQKSIRHASSTPSSSTELRKPLSTTYTFPMVGRWFLLVVSTCQFNILDSRHMVQHRFEGPGATAFLQRITPASIANLALHQGGLSCLLHPGTGGIVDDTIITRLGPELFYVVTNAGCREKDLKYLGEELEAFTKEGGEKVGWEVLDGWGLVALQGPESEEILKELLAEEMKEGGFDNFLFGQSRFVKIRLADGSTSGNLLVSRGGYTGEDGFEISIPESETVMVTESLLKSAGETRLQLAGLGARDSLRLEAGMCLYGHDLDDTTTPVEAALGWVVGKERRTEGGFHGAEVILKQLTPKSKGGSGVERRRIGLIVEGAPAREGADIVNDKGEKIGNITSGCPSPTLGKNVAMGYIKDGFHKAGTDVSVVVRGKERKAKVTKMPFVPSKYWKGTSGTAPA
ncbi:glycine cleavage system T protein [Botrytis cinerea]